MLTLTSTVETPLHGVRAGIKLAALCVFTALLFQMQGPVALATAAAGVALIYAAFGMGFAAQGVRLLRPLWPFAVVIGVWHLWTADLAGGAVILLRLFTAVAAANLVTMTTRLSDMIAVIERLAAPLRHAGLPPRRLALAFALVIRFIPVLSDRMRQITAAWRARSPRRPGWRVLLPATLAALDDADHVAEALRARGGVG